MAIFDVSRVTPYAEDASYALGYRLLHVNPYTPVARRAPACLHLSTLQEKEQNIIERARAMGLPDGRVQLFLSLYMN